MIGSLEQREVFHIAFLRQLATVLKPNTYAVKGGTNLRLFFGSIRYSEDMDLDVTGIEVFRLKEVVQAILESKILATTLRPFGINRIVPPDMKTAKQTETTQRFKLHLITDSREDLFTKIEFSRRRLDPNVVTEPIDMSILSAYRLHPLLVSHYPVAIAIAQKIEALAMRSTTQARDVFDLYMLLPKLKDRGDKLKVLSQATLKKASVNAFELDFNLFRDTVIAYLKDEDRRFYDNKGTWEQIQIEVVNAIEEHLPR
ncbi:MAG: nucleotidyl transferase AbiEii/AbiGii toxin family protein [bacterium]